MKSKKERMKKQRENPVAKVSYRFLSEKIALLISKTGVTPNQISLISVITAVISGIFFALGTWNYLLMAFVFLQLTVLLDHVDGNLARYTDNCTALGEWIDVTSNKLHRFFFILGASIGVFRITSNPLFLILGIIAIFNWIFTGYISEGKKALAFKKSLSLVRESKKAYFPVSLILYNLLGLSALINRVDLALWFFSIFGLVWIKQIYNIIRQWKKENSK